MWEGAGDEHNCNILTPKLWPSALSFSFSRAAQPEALGLLCWVMAFFILSATSLDPNSSGPQAPSAWCGFPYHISSPILLPATPLARWTQLSYKIVRRPLDLWNRMFNRHQAEITVMQFTGHSLPVHQSMSVPWEFFGSFHFISQFPPTRFPLITAIRISHLLPVHHLGMAFLAGSKGQNTTTVDKDGPKAPFSVVSTTRCWARHYLFPWIAPIYTWSDPYLIMQSVKQAGIKCHFKSLLWLAQVTELWSPGSYIYIYIYIRVYIHQW